MYSQGPFQFRMPRLWYD